MHHTFIQPIESSGFGRALSAKFKRVQLNHVFEGLCSNLNNPFLAFQQELKFLYEFPPGLHWIYITLGVRFSVRIVLRHVVVHFSAEYWVSFVVNRSKDAFSCATESKKNSKHAFSYSVHPLS